MMKKKRFFSIFLCLCLILSCVSMASAQPEEEKLTMQQFVEALGEEVDGEEMFDYLSYVYLGWRTTGGRWQNQVIDDFIVEQLKSAGYNYVGAASTELGVKGSNDMSGATDDDYAWVTYYNVDTLTWDPEYAKLEITTEADFEGKDALIDRVNVESAAFNPTTDTYLDHYGVDSIDEMWAWITEKDADGNRVNVLNGKEAELNQRCHLAWNSCFTDPAGTAPADAVGVSGQVVYIGTVSRSGSSYVCAKYLLKSPSQEYQALEAACLEALALRMEKSLAAAEEFLAEEVTHTGLVELPASEPTFAADGNIACWYCENCGKYFKDAAGTQELSADEVLIPFVAPVAQAGEGGSVTFNEDMTVATITADSGYSIKDVQLNGKSLGTVKTVEGLKSGDVLTVAFEKITAPETGDATPVVTLLALLALSGGALLALRRRRSF